jgi:hypothetical protein
MTVAQRKMAVILLAVVVGSCAVTIGLAMLGVAWVVLPVQVVVWVAFITPVVRMTVALDRLYTLADQADEDGAVGWPDQVATCVEWAMYLSSRARRRVWASEKVVRDQEAARGE